MKQIFSTVRNFLIGAAVGCVIFCALGLVAHAFVGFWTPTCETETCAEYSLSNRFETAFSFSTPERHKHYYDTYPDGDSSGAPAGEQRYIAHPIATYGFLILCGVLGALPNKKEEKENK